MPLKKTIISIILSGSIFSHAALAQKQVADISLLHDKVIPVAQGIATMPVLAIFTTIVHEFGHALMDKIICGEFGSYICLQITQQTSHSSLLEKNFIFMLIILAV